jgi:hypothetical protein
MERQTSCLLNEVIADFDVKALEERHGLPLPRASFERHLADMRLHWKWH